MGVVRKLMTIKYRKVRANVKKMDKSAQEEISRLSCHLLEIFNMVNTEVM
jgi:hypothetical protein